MMHKTVNDAANGIDKLASIGTSFHTFVSTFPDYDKVLNTFRSCRLDNLDLEKMKRSAKFTGFYRKYPL